MSPEQDEEQALVGRARRLIEQGEALRDLHDLSRLDDWDAQVNALLEHINSNLASGRFASRSLKTQLSYLIDLYWSVLASLSRKQDDRAAEAAELHQDRWSITG